MLLRQFDKTFCPLIKNSLVIPQSQTFNQKIRSNKTLGLQSLAVLILHAVVC